MAYELPNYPNHPAFQGFAGLSGAIPMRNTTGYRGLGRSYIGEAGQYGASDIPIGPNLVSASTVTPGGSPAPSSLVESSGAAASPAIPNLSGDTTALPIGVRLMFFAARCGLGYYMGSKMVRSAEHKQMYGAFGAIINGLFMDGIASSTGLAAMVHFGAKT